MPISELRWIKRCAEFRPRDKVDEVPRQTRGLYTLLRYRPRLRKFDVVYVGIARGARAGVRGRLQVHAASFRKGFSWTHFSVFAVHDNISEQEVAELEGLFRHIYREDTRANRLNRQRSYKKLSAVRCDEFGDWNRDLK